VEEAVGEGVVSKPSPPPVSAKVRDPSHSVQELVGGVIEGYWALVAARTDGGYLLTQTIHIGLLRLPARSRSQVDPQVAWEPRHRNRLGARLRAITPFPP
jgi:hypothetical protein